MEAQVFRLAATICLAGNFEWNLLTWQRLSLFCRSEARKDKLYILNAMFAREFLINYGRFDFRETSESKARVTRTGKSCVVRSVGSAGGSSRGVTQQWKGGGGEVRRLCSCAGGMPIPPPTFSYLLCLCLALSPPGPYAASTVVAFGPTGGL